MFYNMLHTPLYFATYNMTLTEVWGDVDEFLKDYHNTVFTNSISDTSATTLYYLLYATYGNRGIKASDINRFKYKLFSTIYKYGPTWQKRLEIQEALRELDLDELRESSRVIYNHSMNPSTKPSTQTLDELITINDQNVTKHKRSKTDAYALLIGLLDTDVTEEFLAKFKSLFSITGPTSPLWYTTEIKSDNIVIGDEDNDA